MQVPCTYLEGCRVTEAQDAHLQPHKLVDYHQSNIIVHHCNNMELGNHSSASKHEPCMQDDAVVISPRIDTLDCNDLGPYLPHGLGSVNAMMLGASVCSAYFA